MKKIVILGIVLILITGCGSKETSNDNTSKDSFKSPYIGTWTTHYELGMYGEITQTYKLNEDKTCKKILITDMEIVNECTYEVKEDKIEFTYEDGKTSTVSYRIEEDTLVIGGYKHTKSN